MIKFFKPKASDCYMNREETTSFWQLTQDIYIEDRGPFGCHVCPLRVEDVCTRMTRDRNNVEAYVRIKGRPKSFHCPITAKPLHGWWQEMLYRGGIKKVFWAHPIFKKIDEGCIVPGWYGVSYCEPYSMKIVCYIIPLNFLVAWGRSIWIKLKFPRINNPVDIAEIRIRERAKRNG